MIIPEHSIPLLESGLSHMQEQLQRSPKFVRLVSAPTGSGKSYAFGHAVLHSDATVLFIVPTKRLLQNLKMDVSEQMRRHLRDQGLSVGQIEDVVQERILEWSRRQVSDEGKNLRDTRVRQLLSVGQPQGGRIIFAIAEVVISMLSGLPLSGASTINPFTYLRQFDHIVFDEFHTIDDRSFGLACLFCLLAVDERQGKVTMLSATPLDITGILEKLGIPLSKIELIDEWVVRGHPPGHRAIHGDVDVSFRDCAQHESIAANISKVKEAIDGGFQVIVIYDSLERLMKEEQDVRAILQAAGIRKVFEMHSIADSARKAGQRGCAQKRDPRNYDVLLCTSVVEVGVTFRSTLMFMEPGFNTASFIQRVGRVARGSMSGSVIVSLPPSRHSHQNSWIGKVRRVVDQHNELETRSFARKVFKDRRQHLEPSRDEVEADLDEHGASVDFYRCASWRGAFWAALFIVALIRKHMRVQKGARERIRGLAPQLVRFVEYRVRDIESVRVVNECLTATDQPHKRWVQALLFSSFQFRRIGAKVTVVDPDGTRYTALESFLRRNAPQIPLIFCDEDGDRVLYLEQDSLKQLVRKSAGLKKELMLSCLVRSPIGEHAFRILVRDGEMDSERVARDIVRKWHREFASYLQGDSDPHDPKTKVIRAATCLIRVLGQPPMEEDFADAASESVFIA